MPEKKFSFGSFILGFIFGVLIAIALTVLAGLFWAHQVASGNIRMDEGFLKETTMRIIAAQQQQSTFVYGRIVQMNGDSLVLEGQMPDGVQALTFRTNANTEFITMGYDTVPTEEYFSPKDLMVGTYVTVYTEKPIGAEENQLAVKVTKL